MRLLIGVGAGVICASLVTGCTNSAGSDYPIPEVSVSDGDGSLVVGEGSTLPADWPSDVPVPEGLRLQSVADSQESEVALYLGPGSATAIGEDLSREFEDAGYTVAGTTADGPATATTFVKGATSVAVNVDQTGTHAAITLTVKRAQ